tara:strand:- start:172 stop:366 length:195 start_codon:yes stop_codon:yes gene_type:complete
MLKCFYQITLLIAGLDQPQQLVFWLQQEESTSSVFGFTVTFSMAFSSLAFSSLFLRPDGIFTLR